MNPTQSHRWIRIALINLLILATVGLVLRYKILYPLPFIDQKHLLHGHSHFAFAGWITQALMTLMVAYLERTQQPTAFKKYQLILLANLFTAYGMLVTFPIQGYGAASITFSTLSIVVSYIFAVKFWKDLNRSLTNTPAQNWFKAALVFNIISSAGAFALSIMMAKKIIHQNWYLAAQYFYLHFQYNGWFFFACMGLFTDRLLQSIMPAAKINTVFRLFALACVPAYFLSTLWMNIPTWAYILVILSAIAQVVGWARIVLALLKNKSVLRRQLTGITRWLLGLSGLALTIKLLLQAGSTIPSLSILAFSFRPIVIGYLHLVLLGVITLYIIGHIYTSELIHISKKMIIGAVIFSCGIMINELLLMAQGVAALADTNLPFIQESLLLAACIMLSGLLILNSSRHSQQVR